MERDINEIFDDIVLTEEKCTEIGYADGLAVGREEGIQDGFVLGYKKGVDLGQELGEYYGTVVAYIFLTKSEKTKKLLQTLKTTIDNFPKENDPEADLIGAIENIRTQYKKIKTILNLPSSSKEQSSKDLGF